MKFTYDHRPAERYPHGFRAPILTPQQAQTPEEARAFLAAIAEVEGWCADQFPRPPRMGRDFWHARTIIMRGGGRLFVVKFIRDIDGVAFRMRWT